MTVSNLTLVAATRVVENVVGVADVRCLVESDLDELGRLYFDSYPPGVVGADVAEATGDIASCFEGEYGDLNRGASLVAVDVGRLVGAVLVVEDAPWEDTPAGPFIIELMTAPSERRRGVGRRLVLASMSVLASQGHERVGLRVDETNAAAISLYDGLGFVSWDGS